MAPVLKRVTMERALSTASSGSGGAPCRIEVEQVAQAHDASRFVQARAVRLERRGVVETHRALQQKDGLGVDEVVLAVQRAPLGEAERG
mgnify:CR=1 FL=1